MAKPKPDHREQVELKFGQKERQLIDDMMLTQQVRAGANTVVGLAGAVLSGVAGFLSSDAGMVGAYAVAETIDNVLDESDRVGVTEWLGLPTSNPFLAGGSTAPYIRMGWAPRDTETVYMVLNSEGVQLVNGNLPAPPSLAELFMTEDQEEWVSQVHTILGRIGVPRSEIESFLVTAMGRLGPNAPEKIVMVWDVDVPDLAHAWHIKTPEEKYKIWLANKNWYTSSIWGDTQSLPRNAWPEWLKPPKSAFRYDTIHKATDNLKGAVKWYLGLKFATSIL